ncbi:hypothetical protein CYY_007385 [Polysphondylium violaceum]|uniref:TLDc domain-containing protein n=1 Tax=Polysphondylium violaceum TaxID=133409 RepID=A0A8J4UQX2_9MYCE|nr:hypothetical protein CYY_007385 [Polysphondylium violaceum]
MYSINNNTTAIVENSKRKNIKQSIESVQSLFIGHFESLQQQIKDLEKRKEVLLNVTKVIDVSVIPDPITLNIGGFKHQTTKATLTKIPNSFFDLMLSGEIDIKPMTNKPNTYFIDRDGTHFNYILNYLRDEGDIQIPEDIRHCIRKEMEFYRINDYFKLDDTVTIIDQLNSLKLKLDETEEELAFKNEESKKKTKYLKEEVNSLKDKLLAQLNNLKLAFSLILNHHTFKILRDWIDNTKLTNFELLYSASKTNEYSQQAFHSACDDNGATITLVETTDGCVFGGYNSQSWNSEENEKNFVAGDSRFGPAFGNEYGYDLVIQVTQDGSYQEFPTGYNDTTGKGITTLNPTENFHIKYLEIYKCS